MPSLVAEATRRSVSGSPRNSVQDENKTQNGVHDGVVKSKSPRPSSRSSPEAEKSEDQNAGAGVGDSTTSNSPVQQQEQQQEKSAPGSTLRRNSLDKKPIRASPPKPGLPRKQQQKSPSPSKSVQSRKAPATKYSPPEKTTHKAEELREPPEAHINGSSNNPDEHSPSNQREPQAPKLVNNNALHLLKLARASHIASDNPLKAIDYASRAATLLEKEESEASNLELVLCLHIVAAGYCRLGRYEEAVKVLESSLLIPNVEQGSEQALACFAGHMQLGDTLSLVGKHEKALDAYHSALSIQKHVLGDMDPRVAETCRYLSEAHLQVMQFDEAHQLCQHILDIHCKHSPAGSIEEAIDRKLMALIYTGKGDYESALEHLVLASTTLSCSGQETDVASVDCSIGEAYFALGRYDEAVFSYQKALTILKAAKGESHAAVAAVYVSLADLYLKTGKQREAKTYCENALKIFGKSNAGHAADELSSGLVEVAGVYEAMGEKEQALVLLKRALGILQLAPGEQSAAAGVEAQVGVLLFVMGKFREAHGAFRNAIAKLKFGTDKDTSFLGVLFNQLGLASVELHELSNAVDSFEEARRILTKAMGAHHPDTLSVCSNLAGCYDALGRVEDAIALLENVVEVREEQLGTVHPEVTRDRERLVALLKGVGRSRNRKTSTLEELLLLPNAQAAATS